MQLYERLLSYIIGINAVLYSHFLWGFYPMHDFFALSGSFNFFLSWFLVVSSVRQYNAQKRTISFLLIYFDRSLDKAKPFLCFALFCCVCGVFIHRPNVCLDTILAFKIFIFWYIIHFCVVSSAHSIYESLGKCYGFRFYIIFVIKFVWYYKALSYILYRIRYWNNKLSFLFYALF